MRNRIVVGVDSSPASLAALQWAFDRAQSQGESLLALHIFDPEKPSGQPERPSSGRDEISAAAQLRILAALPPLDSEMRVMISTPSGSLAASLAAAAAGADMIVVGRPQSPAHADLPQQLVAACACPVVQVDEDGTAVELSSTDSEPA